MGLDAIVFCRCWAEGRSTPPPVLPHLIRELPDGDLELDLPLGTSDEEWFRFDRRRIEGCAHEDGWYARERVGSWGRRLPAVRRHGRRRPLPAALRPVARRERWDGRAAGCPCRPGRGARVQGRPGPLYVARRPGRAGTDAGGTGSVPAGIGHVVHREDGLVVEMVAGGLQVRYDAPPRVVPLGDVVVERDGTGDGWQVIAGNGAVVRLTRPFILARGGARSRVEVPAPEPIEVVQSIRALRVVLTAAIEIDRPVVWC